MHVQVHTSLSHHALNAVFQHANTKAAAEQSTPHEEKHLTMKLEMSGTVKAQTLYIKPTLEQRLPLQCALAPLESRDLRVREHGECGGQHILAHRQTDTQYRSILSSSRDSL